MSKLMWKKIKIKINNIWVFNTLNVWDTVRRKYGMPNSISRALPIANNPDFKPSLLDASFKRWGELGLLTVNQLLEGDYFKSFAQLQKKFNLPSTDLFRYFQIRHYVTAHKEWEILKRSPSGVEQYFIHLIEKKIIVKHCISNIYKTMIDDSENTNYIKEKWELEANIIIDDYEWEDSLFNSHSIISSPTWKEFDWKVKVRFFRTPMVVYGFFPSSSPLC